MTTTSPGRRTAVLLVVAALVVVATVAVGWRLVGSDSLLRTRLATVDGVAEAEVADGTAWVRLEPDLEPRDVEATFLELGDVVTRRSGPVAVAPPDAPTGAGGVPTTYVELAWGDRADDAAPILLTLDRLPEDLDVSSAVARADSGSWRLDAQVAGDPGDLPPVAGAFVDAALASDADRVTQLDVEVGVAAGAGVLEVECRTGIAEADDRLIELIRAQGPGWAVGTTVGCVGPSTAEFLVQDAEDRAPQRRRAARELSDDWTFSIDGG